MKKVLLVDDDSIFQMLGAKTLNRIGYADHAILTATNGRQALDIMVQPGDTTKPDVILLDLNMPVMNGFEFMEAMQKLSVDQQRKIVVVTSSGNPDDMKRAFRLGATEFLTKPLKDGELQAALEAA